jgi:hypothetical protein
MGHEVEAGFERVHSHTGAGPRVTWLTANIPRYQRADVVEWLRQATV